MRPHIGTLAVMPNNTENYIDEEAEGGANTIPPARFGGNIDDWRIGKGGTMFYRVEVPGAQIVVGDTHAAQGDSELAGTAMETSMTAKLRVTLHKAGSLPTKVATLDFPLLETLDKFVVHGFAYDNYLDQLADPSDIFSEGTSLDLAMADCYIKTRNWMMDVYSLTEEETIALMTTSVDFGITQVVDGNWGVHAGALFSLGNSAQIIFLTSHRLLITFQILTSGFSTRRTHHTITPAQHQSRLVAAVS